MRVFLAALSLLASAASSHAQGSIGGLAGTIDNAAEAASLQSVARVLNGAYTIKNVATGQALTYERDGNHIVPDDGAGTPVNILGYGNGVNWVRMQIGDKDKCLSSQWGGSYNLAGVMYACAVDEGGEITRADNTLEGTKQWWVIVPVGSNFASASSHSNGVLLAAQAESVATRAKAHKNGIVAHFNKKNGRRATMHGEACGDAARFELVSRAARRTRKDWRSKKSGGGSTKKQKQQQQKKAAAKKKAAASKKKAASSSSKKKVAANKKVVSKAKSTAQKPKPKKGSSAAKKPVAKKVSSSSSGSSKKKTSTSGKRPASHDLGLKLNVAVSQKYYIIPVDHLIDMHTLALTGHQIDSFRAQSTALDLWDANDRYQQWTIERV
ncbi:hypothetical protein JCM11251_001180 [Rhodosporidiobolus azoricus]